MGNNSQEEYAHLLAEYRKIQSEMDQLKKTRTDQFIRALPDDFKSRLCEMNDQEVADFAEDMPAAVMRWVNSSRKKVYRDSKKQNSSIMTKKEIPDLSQMKVDTDA